MAAGFLIKRILLVFLLSELDLSSAFPRAWQGERKTGGYGYGNRRPLQYIQSLKQPHRKLQPNVHDRVRVKTWQKPQQSSLKVLSHGQIQKQPSVYHQTQSPHQPWSDVATKGTQEVSPSQHPPKRNYLLTKPRSFEFNLKIPFLNILGQNKENGSTTTGSDLISSGSDGAGHYSQLYRPSRVQINSVFNSPSGSDGLPGKGSTDDPNGGKSAHEVSKPHFQLSLSVPIPPTNPSPIPASSHSDHLANQKRPGSVGFVQNSYMEMAEPQSSSPQSGPQWIFSNSDSTVQQKIEHQMFEPVQTKYTDSTLITFSPGHASQHTAPISQGKSPSKQSLLFPEPSTPSLPISQYPPPQTDHVHSGYYSSQINPLSNDYGKDQSGQTVSPDQTNVHLSLSPSQYERIPSGQYSADQVKPSHNNYGQSQIWQSAGAPLAFAFGSDGLSGKGSTNVPNGGENVNDVSKPHFQLSLSVPIPPTNPSPTPASSHGGHLANQKRPGSVGFIQNSYMEMAEPQSSSTQSGSQWIFSNSDSTVQQQTEHQTFEPVQTKYTDSTLITFSPGHASQHTAPISQGKSPSKQSLLFPEPSTPSLPISQYPPPQTDHVHSGYYSSQINPLSNDYGKVKPSHNNYGQSQIWQPAGAPPTFASEQYNYGQFNPSSGQNVETVPHLSPIYPSSPSVAPHQYERPSSHWVATANYYGTGNVAQMVPTDLSSPYHQDPGDQSRREALPQHLTAFDPLSSQGLPTDYQTQMRLPGYDTDRGQLDVKPKYTQLFIDDEDVMDQYASYPQK